MRYEGGFSKVKNLQLSVINVNPIVGFPSIVGFFFT